VRSRAGHKSQEVERAMREAATLCKRRGGGMTPLRQKALTLLLEADGPTKAYDLLTRLRDDGGAKPPTVYRTLGFLLKMGLIHRVESLQAYAPCRDWSHDHAPAFLICDACGAVEEIDVGESLVSFTRESRRVGFKAGAAVVEIRGACATCVQVASSPRPN